MERDKTLELLVVISLRIAIGARWCFGTVWDLLSQGQDLGVTLVVGPDEQSDSGKQQPERCPCEPTTSTTPERCHGGYEVGFKNRLSPAATRSRHAQPTALPAGGLGLTPDSGVWLVGQAARLLV
ncbi:MAG: hypothetical protein GY722_11910 [bacterium]|nr:hypothetical protein [bacterium]